MTVAGDEPVESQEWCEDDDALSEDYPIEQYDLTSTPNDFNVLTIHSFIESGAVKIPGFQRNYVWDLRKASKLVESLIIGLPVPQVFLYEEDRNKFLVIDGQQRLMSIYYFMKLRFPRIEKRTELRRLFDEMGKIPEEVLQNDTYFQKFNLSLPERVPNQPNRFNGLNYHTLGDYRTSFDLRPIRNIIVKQVAPRDDDSAVYEIFNRLNSGGVNLTPQEIRASMYHSRFYGMLNRVNLMPEWRRLLGLKAPDLHMKDIEVLLRGFSVAMDHDTYSPSMVKFLNQFSRKARRFDDEKIRYLESLFKSFLAASADLQEPAFFGSSSRFSITVFESVFGAYASPAYRQNSLIDSHIDRDALRRLKDDPAFRSAAERQTTSKSNLRTRLARAGEILNPAGGQLAS